MLLFSLLAKVVEKVEVSRDEMLESRFAQRGCSKTNMAERLEAAELRHAELRRKVDEQQRRAEEAGKAKKSQRPTQEAST